MSVSRFESLGIHILLVQYVNLTCSESIQICVYIGLMVNSFGLKRPLDKGSNPCNDKYLYQHVLSFLKYF